jgi:hypothetical protein
MAEKTEQQEVVKDEVKAQSAVTAEIKEKLEDVAESLVEQASKSTHPWYAKAALYVVAVILGGIAFLCANFGEQIMSIIETWLNGLAN